MAHEACKTKQRLTQNISKVMKLLHTKFQRKNRKWVVLQISPSIIFIPQVELSSWLIWTSILLYVNLNQCGLHLLSKYLFVIGQPSPCSALRSQFLSQLSLYSKRRWSIWEKSSLWICLNLSFLILWFSMPKIVCYKFLFWNNHVICASIFVLEEQIKWIPLSNRFLCLCIAVMSVCFTNLFYPFICCKSSVFKILNLA